MKDFFNLFVGGAGGCIRDLDIHFKKSLSSSSSPSILLLIYIVSSSSTPTGTDFDTSFLCAGAVLGEGRCAPAAVPAGHAPLSSVKHICLATIFS